MWRGGRGARWLGGLGAGLFAALIVAGIVQSLHVDGGPPSINLPSSGATQHVNDLLARKDYQAARQQLELWSQLFPSDAFTHEQLGKLLGTLGLPKEARVHFQEVVRLRPGYAKGHHDLGLTYNDTREPARALACFSEAIRLNPDFSAAYGSMGITLARLGKLPQAEQCFAKAVALSPDDPDARANLDRVRANSQRRP